MDSVDVRKKEKIIFVLLHEMQGERLNIQNIGTQMNEWRHYESGIPREKKRAFYRSKVSDIEYVATAGV